MRRSCAQSAVNMADMSKAEKLAAARKKLREFQHNKESPPPVDSKQVRNTPDKLDVRSQTLSDIPYKNGVDKRNSTYPPQPPLENTQKDTFINASNNYDNSSYFTNEAEKSDVKTTSISHLIESQNLNQTDFHTPPSKEDKQNEYDITSSTPVASDLISYTEVEEPLEAPTADMVRSTSETLRQLAMQMNGLIGHELDSTASPTLIADESAELGNNSDKTELLNRNQILATHLAEKERINAHLQASLAQLQTQASFQEAELSRTLAEAEQKWSAECAALREQLQLHTQTVGILVAEKTEAQAALSRAQLAAKTKAAEAEEAQGRLRASRQKLSELESALLSVRSGQESGDERLRETRAQLERVREQLAAMTAQRDEGREETSQLQQRLHASTQQVAALQAELHERHSQLSIAQVRLQQLGSSVPGGAEVSEAQAELQAEHERRMALEREVAELRNAASEREQTSQQYQQFIQQLNAQLTSLAAKLQESSRENEESAERHQSLMKHVQELESRLQRPPPPSHTPSTEDTEEKKRVEEELAALHDIKLQLENKLTAKEAAAAELQSQLAQAEQYVAELKEGRPDEAKLLAAMESDKVAAARATAQNTQLKQQMLEQRHVHDQLVDRLRSFEARAQQAEILQKDLLQAQDLIKSLKNEVAQMRASPSTEAKEESSQSQPAELPGALTPEAAARLQDRFSQTMRQLAETFDEKQKLEHLVMQLQGETETIGEYVALYQQQRGLLQQRAAEKDREMDRMAADREQMRQKLKRVGQLVSDLVNPGPSTESTGDTSFSELQVSSSHTKPVSIEVAAQISALLSEIGDSEALAAPVLRPEVIHHSDAHPPTDTMLPCPLCSGRLEVV